MSYYQKYRPGIFGDSDLDSARGFFEKLMENGEVSHAFLFVGPKGIGKTSSARILARLVNCEKNIANGKLKKKLQDPCGVCDSCLSIIKGSATDYLEIDAASHGLVDDVRELKEKVNLAPISLLYKIYVIDEVHMMSNGAFNALLKTIEEPPERVIFILCTTEVNKIPETIISRCVRVNFAKASKQEIVSALIRAAKGESLEYEELALALIADFADGSFREAHKLLEQLKTAELLTENYVREQLRFVSGEQVSALLEFVHLGQAKELTDRLSQLEESGVLPLDLIKKILELLRFKTRIEVMENGVVRKSDMRLMSGLIKCVPRIRVSPLPYLPLELILVRECLRRNRGTGGSKKEIEKPMTVEVKKEQPEKELAAVSRVKQEWSGFLSNMSNPSLAGILRGARPKEIDGKFLTLEVSYKFHKDQIENETKRKILEEQIAKVWGPYSVRCTLIEKGIEKLKEEVVVGQEVGSGGSPDHEVVTAAEEIFGS